MSQKKIEEGMTKPKNSLQKWFVHCSTENINLIDFGDGQRKKFSGHKTETVLLFFRGERAKSGGGRTFPFASQPFFPL